VNHSVPAGGVLTLPSLTNTVTLRVRASGYSDPSPLFVAPLAGQTALATVALSPNATGGQVRIVLTWGANPSDLDAWLTGPTSSGGRFSVGWESPGNCNTSPFVCLPVDDTTGFGPETIWINQQLPGVYRYAVHHFDGTGSIATSGARVEVYISNQLVGTFTPPPGGGDWWTVFELSNGVVRAVNTYGTRPSIVTGPSARATGKLTSSSARRP
jgi:hypothetical protein